MEKIPDLYKDISIDIKGHIKAKHFKKSSKHKVFYIIAIIELLSKYTEIIIPHDISAKTVSEAVESNYLNRNQSPNNVEPTMVDS